MKSKSVAKREAAMGKPVNQDQPPNFRSNGKLYLVRCFNCDEKRGRENWAPAVSSGACAFCGWKE